MGLITTLLHRYFLLFKLIAKHTAISAFIQLVET